MTPPSEQKRRLLVVESEQFSPRAAQCLEQAFDVAWCNLDRTGLLERVPDVDGLWVRLAHRIDEEVFSRGKRLQFIATNTTGLNHIDLAAAAQRGIEVISLRGEETFLRDIRATAELTIALTLALLRRIPQAHQHVLDGHWDRNQFRGSEIYRRRVGIIGYGRLGRIVAGYFHALGANVQVCSRDLPPGSSIDGFPVLAMEQLLESSAIVSLHANYEPSNHHMIGPTQIARMNNAYLINTARGELVDEEALCCALERGSLAGAALDVLDDEYRCEPSQRAIVRFARRSDRVILTPHLGGNTTDSAHRTEEFLAQKLVTFVQNKT